MNGAVCISVAFHGPFDICLWLRAGLALAAVEGGGSVAKETNLSVETS